MPKKTVASESEEVVETPVETPVETVVEAPAEESEAKKAFRAHIEAYKKQNPAKYEQKREALEAKLNSL